MLGQDEARCPSRCRAYAIELVGLEEACHDVPFGRSGGCKDKCTVVNRVVGLCVRERKRERERTARQLYHVSKTTNGGVFGF